MHSFRYGHSLPNLVHMLQTAEGIRKRGHPDWMQLVGLIHDMGKIMFLWGDDSIGQNGKEYFTFILFYLTLFP